MPPFLKVGGVLEFSTPGQLMRILQGELSAGRVSAVDRSGLQLRARIELKLTIEGYADTKTILGTVVHRSGDIVGLHVPCDSAQISELAMLAQHAAQELGLDHWEPQNESSDDSVVVTGGDSGAGDVPSSQHDVVHPSAHRPEADPEVGETNGTGLLVGTSFDAGSGAEARLGSSEGSEAQHESLNTQQKNAKAKSGLLSPIEVSEERLARVNSILEVIGHRSKGTLFGVFIGLCAGAEKGRFVLSSGIDRFWLQFGTKGSLDDFSGGADRLLAAGIVSREDVGNTGEGVAELVNVAMRKGAKGKDVLPVLEQSLSATLSLWSRREGVRYGFELGATEDGSGELRLPATRFLHAWLSEALKGIRVGELEMFFAQRMDEVPQLLKGGLFDPLLFAPDPRSQRFLEVALPKGETLRRLLRFSPLNKAATMRFLLALECLGLIGYGEDQGSVIEMGGVMSTLRALALRGREGYFEALGLHVTSHPSEYSSALEVIRQTYSADSANASGSPEAAELCSEIVNHAMDAYTVLTRRPKRVMYRAERYTQTELAGFSTLLREKMRIAILRGNDRRARLLQEMALELDPKGFRRAMLSDQEEDDE